jgi:hypothetical protein
VDGLRAPDPDIQKAADLLPACPTLRSYMVESLQLEVARLRFDWRAALATAITRTLILRTIADQISRHDVMPCGGCEVCAGMLRGEIVRPEPPAGHVLPFRPQMRREKRK